MADLALIDAIAEAVTRHAWEVAAQHIVALWARVRAPELAELLDTLDLQAQRTSPGSVTRFDLEDLRSASLIERGRLLTALRERPELLVGSEPKSSEAQAALVALFELFGELDPDPRISASILRLMDGLPLRFEQEQIDGMLQDYCLDEREPYTGTFCQLCLHHFSPVMISQCLFSERVALPEQPTELEAQASSRLFEILLDLRAILFDDETDRLMCAAVVDDPFDEDALRVYADWLMSRGDERGALITATLAKGQPEISSRYEVGEHAFGHMNRWAGSDLQDRGWATRVRFGLRETPWPKLDWARLETGWRPGWAAVESLFDPPAELLAHTRWPALRRLSCDGPTLDPALVNGVEFPRLTHLALTLERSSTGEPDLDKLSARLEYPGVPQLRSLFLTRQEHPRALTPWLARPGRITELFTRSSISHEIAWARAATWLGRLRSCASPLRRVIVTSSAGERWIFEHRSDGVDWQAVRLEYGSTVHVHLIKRLQLVHSMGVEDFCVVTKEPIPPLLVGKLRRAGNYRTEVDPELPSFHEWR